VIALMACFREAIFSWRKWTPKVMTRALFERAPLPGASNDAERQVGPAKEFTVQLARMMLN
jgi:hypothetical protein